jgi:kumamolisin
MRVGRERLMPLPGSFVGRPAGLRLGPAPPLERLRVTVALRISTEQLGRFVRDLYNEPPTSRRHLTREEYVERFGSSEEDIAAVCSFAGTNDLDVIEVHPGKHTIELEGTTVALSQAFGVQLSLFKGLNRVFRAPSGPVRLPAGLAPIVLAVLGLDTRPIARPYVRPGGVIAEDCRASGQAASFSPVDIARLYDFPDDADGSGQTIGLIELGGGFKPDDLVQYFNEVGISPAPSVEAISIDGGRNFPTGQSDGPDVEVMQDIEIAGAIAPRASLAVYFSPNNVKGFVAALLNGIHDAERRPSVIAIGWGAPEEVWPPQARRLFNQACFTGLALGITVVAASGDSGSSNGWPPYAHVNFPASSPFVIGCGGTTLVGNGGEIISETVWNNAGTGATGGGVSWIFPVPSFQTAIHPQSANPFHIAGRGVPDVSGNADPNTGYSIRVNSQAMVTGGTSAVAALWAGLLVRINQLIGHSVAPIAPLLYANARVFRDILSGDNGVYRASPGWDACTGLGSPVGSKLAHVLGARAVPGAEDCASTSSEIVESEASLSGPSNSGST